MASLSSTVFMGQNLVQGRVQDSINQVFERSYGRRLFCVICLFFSLQLFIINYFFHNLRLHFL